MHGRDLLKQGLMKVVGNGETTSVWMDNWIKDPLPRAPKYKQETVVDLTLKVCDLMTDDQCG